MASGFGSVIVWKKRNDPVYQQSENSGEEFVYGIFIVSAVLWKESGGTLTTLRFCYKII
jgi:hypothetical protein